jgi:hypothetical protein
LACDHFPQSEVSFDAYSWSVGIIQADVAGLSALAANCEEHAAVMGAVGAPSPSAGLFQPSAIAVDAAHTDVAAAGTRLMLRTHATAAAFAGAAGGFESTEATSAIAIATVVAAGASSAAMTAA